jgi:hypothetical protein
LCNAKDTGCPVSRPIRMGGLLPTGWYQPHHSVSNRLRTTGISLGAHNGAAASRFMLGAGKKETLTPRPERVVAAAVLDGIFEDAGSDGGCEFKAEYVVHCQYLHRE